MFLEADRNYVLADRVILHFDHAIRTLFGNPIVTERANPAAKLAEARLTSAEKRHIAGLMRVNQAGEVAAQGLYQGQALAAKNLSIKQAMQRSAHEENDHLNWCQNRLKELDSHTSCLNLVWYTGSLLIGIIAGLVGDQWSLGFVEETELQVTQHLMNHQQRLPAHDLKTAKILQQMQIDEAAHADKAKSEGGEELPLAIKKIMQLFSKVMTSTAYYI